MWISERILGATTSRKIVERNSAPVLIIGKDRFTRGDLAKVGCYNYLAAATLSRVIAHDVNTKSVAHLFEHFEPAHFVLPSIGPVALAVLGAAFELAGVGGEQPLEAWVRAHRTVSAAEPFVTFDTLKHREAARESGQRKRPDPPTRPRARRTPARTPRRHIRRT